VGWRLKNSFKKNKTKTINLLNSLSSGHIGIYTIENLHVEFEIKVDQIDIQNR